uniref:Uncharacterized protein n=1 Tax=Timema poppense TaxID=170557 RepID=A0A7R9CGI1_TIMPO|nr:unnamed protein product [Timema poppensis]
MIFTYYHESPVGGHLGANKAIGHDLLSSINLRWEILPGILEDHSNTRIKAKWREALNQLKKARGGTQCAEFPRLFCVCAMLLVCLSLRDWLHAATAGFEVLASSSLYLHAAGFHGAGTFLSSDFSSFFAPKASSRDFTDIWNAELFDYDTCPSGQPSDEKTANFIRSQRGKGKNTGVFPCSNCGKGNEIEGIGGNPVVDCKSSALDHAVTEAMFLEQGL